MMEISIWYIGLSQNNVVVQEFSLTEERYFTELSIPVRAIGSSFDTEAYAAAKYFDIVSLNPPQPGTTIRCLLDLDGQQKD